MLYLILDALRDEWSVLNVFRYITFRTALAIFTALAVSFGLGPVLLRRLRAAQIGQSIREEGPTSHRVKAGTPTMGGILIVLSVDVATVLWADIRSPVVWIALLSLNFFGLIGGLDDYLKVSRRKNLGLRSAQKLGLQTLVAAGIGALLVAGSREGWYSTGLQVPFFKDLSPDLGWGTIPFAALVIVSAANAVNLTDGLDGLAIGCTLVAFSTYTLLAYVAGHAAVAAYLGIAHVAGSSELTIFCGAAAGASLGFLWFNCHPAQVFMGDIGSMALGGSIGTVAVLAKQEILLLVVGGVFVLEAASVIVQVASFKTTGRRVFRMSPLHHHFELLGWHETKVVTRFWILALIFALLSLSTLKVR